MRKLLILAISLSAFAAHAGTCRDIYLKKSSSVPGIESRSHKVCAVMNSSGNGNTILTDLSVDIYPGKGTMNGTKITIATKKEVGSILCSYFLLSKLEVQSGNTVSMKNMEIRNSSTKQSLIMVGEMKGYNKINYKKLTRRQRQAGMNTWEAEKLDIEAVDSVECKE